jgi:hypothetical protein
MRRVKKKIFQSCHHPLNAQKRIIISLEDFRWSRQPLALQMILTDEGLLHMVKCSICSAVRGRVVIMGPKFDTVKKHVKRIELYAVRRLTTVLQQIKFGIMKTCMSLILLISMLWIFPIW